MCIHTMVVSDAYFPSLNYKAGKYAENKYILIWLIMTICNIT
jgi:hypothetical protein